jgi:hypothetical protein
MQSKPTNTVSELHEDFLNFNWSACGIEDLDRLPWQQKAMIERFQEYYHNPHLIPQLAFFKDRYNNDGANRLRRSERRRAHSLILCALALRFDFASAQIGNPCKDGTFYYESLAKLAKIAGLELKKGEIEDEQIRGVSQRFARAWRDLKEAGIVGQYERFQTIDVVKNGFTHQERRAVTAIKFFNTEVLFQVGAFTVEQYKQQADYARLMRTSLQSTRQKAKAASRKIFTRKSRMNKRIQAIFEGLWVNALKMYRSLKKQFPGQAKEWYRGKVSKAFDYAIK